jgi:hypothetical protein
VDCECGEQNRRMKLNERRAPRLHSRDTRLCAAPDPGAMADEVAESAMAGGRARAVWKKMREEK